MPLRSIRTRKDFSELYEFEDDDTVQALVTTMGCGCCMRQEDIRSKNDLRVWIDKVNKIKAELEQCYNELPD